MLILGFLGIVSAGSPVSVGTRRSPSNLERSLKQSTQHLTAVGIGEGALTHTKGQDGPTPLADTAM